MDRTDIAGLLFAISGLTALGRFALDPGFASSTLFSGLIGVGLLGLGVAMYLRDGETTVNADESSVVPVVAVATFLFLLGMGAYVVV